jgi:pimeloyl-ACP methyl ester carboxylesterase
MAAAVLQKTKPEKQYCKFGGPIFRGRHKHKPINMNPLAPLFGYNIRWTDALLYLGVVCVMLFAVVFWVRRKVREVMFYPESPPLTTMSLPRGESGTLVPVRPHDATESIQLVVMEPPNAAAAVLLFAHGNAGYLSKARCAMLRRIANATRCTVVGFDYRGFGLSTPRGFTPTESSILVDGTVALNHVEQHVARKRPIWVWGESMGSAVAAHLAADKRVTGVVMHIGFARLADVAPPNYAILNSICLALLADSLDNAGRLALSAAAHKPVAMIVANDDEIMSSKTSNALEHAIRQNPARRTLRINVDGTHGTHNLDSALPQLVEFVHT